jgi:hypothetical protein
MDVLEKQLIKQSGISQLAKNVSSSGLTNDNQKKWVDLNGNPTNDDKSTHWDENGLLDIREEYDPSMDNDTSGQETDHEVLRSD